MSTAAPAPPRPQLTAAEILIRETIAARAPLFRPFYANLMPHDLHIFVKDSATEIDPVRSVGTGTSTHSLMMGASQAPGAARIEKIVLANGEEVDTKVVPANRFDHLYLVDRATRAPVRIRTAKDLYAVIRPERSFEADLRDGCLPKLLLAMPVFGFLKQAATSPPESYPLMDARSFLAFELRGPISEGPDCVRNSGGTIIGTRGQNDFSASV